MEYYINNYSSDDEAIVNDISKPNQISDSLKSDKCDHLNDEIKNSINHEGIEFHRSLEEKLSMFCYKYVHGFKFNCYKNDLCQKALSFIIHRLVSQCNRQNWSIGYKCGHLERDLYIQAGVEHIVNIEIFGEHQSSKIFTSHL